MADKTGIKAIFRNEFKTSNFGLTYPTEENFCRTQWNFPQIIFLVYRVVVTVYIWAWLVYSIVFMPVFPPVTGHVWPAFLTNWSYTVLAVYLVWAAVVAVYRASLEPLDMLLTTLAIFPREHEENGGEQPVAMTASTAASSTEMAAPPARCHTPLTWYLKVQWGLFAIISNFAFIITLVYFLILFPRIKEKFGVGLRPVDFHIHGVNSIVIIIEMFLTANPVRLLHIIYPILYGLSYVIFSLIYWAFDHEHNVVYKNVLDWNHPGPTIGVILGLALVVIPLLQLMLFSIYRLRVWFYYRFCINRTQTVVAFI